MSCVHPPLQTVDEIDSPRPVSSYFGELTFGLGHMRDTLSRDLYRELVRCLDQGKPLERRIVEEVARVVRDWAIRKGATHYCHWFQPMTGLTAEKHDAFISIQRAKHSELKVIETFSADQLMQGEPDASSFPSGGMRTTFEARGYTAWDATSPLFIVEGERGHTLCIPSVFFGYHGQSLDNKMPLLRSQQALSSAATGLLKLLGDVDIKGAHATLGVEQEYFLIDRVTAARRHDVIMTGRTLIGAPTARGQKLEDHYFGSIPARVKAYMEDLELELYRLGVPVKTRHNEVAPSQFEMAPIFEAAGIAADHNSLAMETMRRVAGRHGFTCLLHEKPFAGINGSGKHCNWSLCNDRGENLLDPGATPHQNLRFLTLVAVVVKAVHDHSDVLRASIASPGNEHRLGGNEAPPAIMSVFLGGMLDTIFDNVARGEATRATDAEILNLGVSHIPSISRDYTDRNRTSPFAFTGNKFEFRAVGSSANVAVPITVLNAAVVTAMLDATERLKGFLAGSGSRDEAVMRLVRELYQESRAVVFSGNNYSAEWRAEAKKRGLPNLASSADAIEVLGDTRATAFLVEANALSEPEIQARHHVFRERYITTVGVELAALAELLNEHVVPSLEKQLLRSVPVRDQASSESLRLREGDRVMRLEGLLAGLLEGLENLDKVLSQVQVVDDDAAKLQLIATRGKDVAGALRALADTAEQLVADELWTLPKYRDILFFHQR